MSKNVNIIDDDVMCNYHGDAFKEMYRDKKKVSRLADLLVSY